MKITRKHIKTIANVLAALIIAATVYVCSYTTFATVSCAKSNIQKVIK